MHRHLISRRRATVGNSAGDLGKSSFPGAGPSVEIFRSEELSEAGLGEGGEGEAIGDGAVEDFSVEFVWGE